MSHEPGRERHMTYRCEKCGFAVRELYHDRPTDQYVCDDCIDKLTHQREQHS